MYRLLTFVLTASLLISAPAWAVEIQITDGFASQRVGGDTAPFDLIGEDFRFTGGFTDTTAGGFAGLPTFGRVGGQVRLLSGELADTAIFALGRGPLTYQGTTMNGAGGSLVLSAPPATVMPTAEGHLFQAIAPFTTTGTAFWLDAPQGSILETFNLTGQGLLTMGFQGNPTVFQDLDLASVRIDFAPPPAGKGGPVIPEPSTVLLVTSGLAGIGLWRRRAKEAATV